MNAEYLSDIDTASEIAYATLAEVMDNINDERTQYVLLGVFLFAVCQILSVVPLLSYNQPSFHYAPCLIGAGGAIPTARPKWRFRLFYLFRNLCIYRRLRFVNLFIDASTIYFIC